MCRYTITILAIVAIILGIADSAGAASPIAEIVSPTSPVEADLLERLEFTIIATDTDNDLNRCEIYVDEVLKGNAYFESPNNGAEAKWTYAFGTPGTHTFMAVPFDLAGNEGDADLLTIEVTNQKGSLDLTVLTYNTHLFAGVSSQWLMYLGGVLYEDETRRDRIIHHVGYYGASGVDVVALQEVWAYPWQEHIVNSLKSVYPYSAYQYSACNSYLAGMDTLSNGVLLLSKWPLSNVAFEKFPTYTQCDVWDGCDAWARKGVLTATLDVDGLSIRIGASHALTGPDDYKSSWLPYYVANSITSFQLNGEAYIFALKTDNTARIVRMEDYSYVDESTQTRKHGAGWKEEHTDPWNSDFRAVVSFELNGHPHLFGLRSSVDEAYIARINDDPSTGWKMFGPYFWDKDYRPTCITSFQLNGQAYIFGLKSGWDQAWFYRINTDPSTGEFNPSVPFEEFGWKPFSRWFGAITSFESNGRPWLYCLKSNYDQVYIQRINEDPSTGKLNRDNPFTIFGPFTQAIDRHFIGETITSYQLNGRTYVFGVKSGWDQAWLYRINDNPSTGLESLGWKPWSRDYIAVESYEMNGHPYLFGLSGCCHDILHLDACLHWRPGEAYLKRINDDPSTWWEDLYQLEDIKIIRDATVAENGPPAIMMGDFNVHAGKYGIMDQLFRKAGAVDAYIEVHGTGEGGQTIDLYNNKLLALFHPNSDPPVSRIDYVYVKQSGAGLRVVPTNARVIREWTYTEDAMDLSDHYPLLLQFRVEMGCQLPLKGDFDCDHVVGFPDLAILCSAWLSGPGSDAWDRTCDISDPGDDFVDMKDFGAFASQWRAMLVHNVTENTWHGGIQKAIDDANDGDEIVVGPGTYYEAIDFKGKAVRLYSIAGPNDTSIDGTGNLHVVQCVSGEDANTILEGFTVTGGNANGAGESGYGGGMYNKGSSPSVTNCIFRASKAAFGGGMFNKGSSPIITNCTFSGNSARDCGGGMYCDKSSATITDCRFLSNSALNDTGAVMSFNGSLQLVNCIFNSNTAADKAGAVYCVYSDKSTIVNCAFIGNSSGLGGGVFTYSGATPTLINCTFSGNSAQNGGGMYIFYNCHAVVKNCIFWGDTPNEIINDTSTTTATYCDVQGGYAGTGNIDADPLFVNAAGGDFRLSSPDSPCIDAGDNNSVPADTADLDNDGNTVEPIPLDLSGNPRMWDGDRNGTATVDMGAYELKALPIHNFTQDRWYETIQMAIDDATNGDEIEVYPGTYYEAINFNGKSVRLYSSGGPGVTTINGTGHYHVVQCVSGEGVNTILEGFTITGGNANGSWPDDRGGGMYNETASPTVTNCIFSGNSAGYGCGMGNYQGSNPTVTDCTFSGNSGYIGGGMCNDQGSNPTVTDCIFLSNAASLHGGGMHNEHSDPKVTNCIFSGNTASAHGGGMMNNYGSVSYTANCVFIGNTANGWGGGMCNASCSPYFINCTFRGNTASSGGAIYSDNSYTNIQNCILWADGANEIVYSSGTMSVTYSDVQGGYSGTGNINADPCFVDAAGGNLHLSTADSPCVDAGNNNAIPADTPDLDGDGNTVEPIPFDLAGNSRVMDGDGDLTATVDMGAYEYVFTSGKGYTETYYLLASRWLEDFWPLPMDVAVLKMRHIVVDY